MYGGAKTTRRKTTARKTKPTSPWHKHVAAYRSRHPRMAYASVLKNAKLTYKPGKGAKFYKSVDALKKKNPRMPFPDVVAKAETKHYRARRRSTTKRAPVKRRITRKTVRKTVRRAARRTARRTTRKTVRRAARKTVRRTTRKTVRRAARKTARKPVRKTARKPVRKTARKPVRKTARKTVRKQTDWQKFVKSYRKDTNPKATLKEISTAYKALKGPVWTESKIYQSKQLSQPPQLMALRQAMAKAQ